MFDMLSGQYKNLASKGRYGDTMLAHINPQEAGLLRSMGGAGTINPQTGLREFYGIGQLQFLPQFTPAPLPSLGQALAPETVADLRTQLDVVTPPPAAYVDGRIGAKPAAPQISSEYAQYADRAPATGMGGGRQVEGYTLPTDKKFQDIPLVAQYDTQGNFKQLTLEPGKFLTPDPTKPNIQSVPRINKKGEITDFGIVDTDKLEDGGFTSMIRELGTELGPIILAAVGSQLATNLGFGGTTAGASSGTGLSLGGGGLGLTAAPGAGLNLAATTGGGLGLTAGSAGAGAIGAGLGTALNAINTGISSGAGASTGLTTGAGTGLTTGGGTGLTTGGGTGLTTGGTGVGTGTGVDYGLTTGGGGTGTGINLGGTGTGINLGGTGIGTGVGTSLIDTIIKNPSIAGTVLGAVTSAVGAANAPTSQTATTSIDPQIKAEYLANLERAKATAAGLEARQIAQPGQLYNDAERQLYNLGMTPFGEADIAKFFNPYQEQVVQGALGDIERTRLMQEQANRDQATRARAFGGSRQAVVSGMTNEAALRQAANTSAQLRSAGYTQAANLGLQARPMDMAGLQTSLGLGTTRTALEQARLDALRNLGTERLGITSGALGMNIPNLGSSSSQPLYNNTAGNLLSGGLTGAYIGSLLQPRTT